MEFDAHFWKVGIKPTQVTNLVNEPPNESDLNKASTHTQQVYHQVIENKLKPKLRPN